MTLVTLCSPRVRVPAIPAFPATSDHRTQKAQVSLRAAHSPWGVLSRDQPSTPPPHCSPSARVSGRGAALPSAGHAGAQPSLLPWSLLVLLPRIRVLITGVLEPPGAVPQPISFGGLGWSCHLHPLCRCPVRGGGGSKAAVCSAWGLNPENCSQVTTSCFVLLQRGSSTGCGPGQGWGLEPLEISPGVHFPRRPGLWAQRWGITVPLKVQIQGQVGAALGEI